jgi:toxin ParE1/3/4
MAFDFLASTPGAGTQLNPPLDSIADLRFWPITRFRNYLILYKPLPDGAEIIRVIHGARDLDKVMREG